MNRNRTFCEIAAGMTQLLFALFAMLSSQAAQAGPYNVGVGKIETEVAGVEIHVRVFYPTSETATETRFGPWELTVARDAKLAPGPFPLVAVSHGLGGNDWNHHLLASDLARGGFVVAAVRHPDDFLRVGLPEIAVLRPRELSAAIDAVLSSNRFAPSLDKERIGAFGFSLGGYTVLAAAGGRVDQRRISEHCQNADNDPEFCTGQDGGARWPLSLRAQRLFYSVPDVDLDQDVIDRRIKAAVVASPVGVLFDDLSRVTMPLLLLRAGNDQSLRYPYHAEHVHNLLPNDHTYQVLQGLHHYAFLSPFPGSIAKEVGEPAIDPEGFDREAFLFETNQVIVEFFRETLLVEAH